MTSSMKSQNMPYWYGQVLFMPARVCHLLPLWQLFSHNPKYIESPSSLQTLKQR